MSDQKVAAKYDGSQLWREMHLRALAFQLPRLDPSSGVAQIEAWAVAHDHAAATERTYLTLIAARLPCGECRQHWVEQLFATPPDFGDYFGWLVARHNHVNEMLGKPTWSLTEAREFWMAEAAKPAPEKSQISNLKSQIPPLPAPFVVLLTGADKAMKCPALTSLHSHGQDPANGYTDPADVPEDVGLVLVTSPDVTFSARFLGVLMPLLLKSPESAATSSAWTVAGSKTPRLEPGPAILIRRALLPASFAPGWQRSLTVRASTDVLYSVATVAETVGKSPHALASVTTGVAELATFPVGTSPDASPAASSEAATALPPLRRVTAIIPAVESPDLTIRCLTALRKSEGVLIRAIVVDGGSSRETIEAVRPLADDVLELGENLGFTGAVNQGLGFVAGSPDHVLILNNDAFVGPSCVKSLLTLLESRGDIAAVGPVTNDAGNESVRKEHVRRWLGLNGHLSGADFNDGDKLAAIVAKSQARPMNAATIPFCCALLNRDALAHFPRLSDDERFASGLFADDEWCYRAKRGGWSLLIDPRAFCSHLGSQTFTRTNQDYHAALARGRLGFLEALGDQTHVAAAVLLCDRKRYSQTAAVEAIKRMHGVKRLYLNIETAFDRDEFDAEYQPLFDLLTDFPIPVEMDITRTFSSWMKAKPDHDQDQYYRLPRIVNARNAACEFVFSRPDISHLLFIDSDVVPDSDDGLRRLLFHRRPLVSGLIHGRGEHSDELVIGPNGKKINELIEVDWASCGYLLIERRVLDRHRFRWGYSRKRPGEMRSEDPAFGEDVALDGFPRWLVDTSITAQHVDDVTNPLAREVVPQF